MLFFFKGQGKVALAGAEGARLKAPEAPPENNEMVLSITLFRTLKSQMDKKCIFGHALVYFFWHFGVCLEEGLGYVDQ